MSNHLKNETSPYLLQHAENPVDWYPWCSEAFEKAEKEDKPIFLSIGYSTCHWCHVMAHESFENRRTAEILNRHFVSVKVDREERPDIDSVYMSVCQAFTGNGGWPMSIFMTWDKKPFFAGTYFPVRPRYGMPGFSDLLRAVAEQWDSHREKLLQSADQIMASLEVSESAPGNTGDENLPEKAEQFCMETVKRFADDKNGGFYLSGVDNAELFINPKESYDGAIPSGNSVMAYNFVRLHQLTEKEEYGDLTNAQLRYMSAREQEYPMGHSMFLLAKLMYDNPPEHVVIALKDSSDLAPIREQLPLLANMLVVSDSAEYPLVNDSTTFYICKDHVCRVPANTL